MKKERIIPRILPGSIQEGISLRDHLAVTVLASILKVRLERSPEKNAQEAYRIADAMMRQRDVIPNESDAISHGNDEKAPVEVSICKQDPVAASPKLPSEKVSLTPTEFASLFGRHYTWAYRQIYAGKIKVISTLGRIMIPRSEVERLLAQKEIYSGKK